MPKPIILGQAPARSGDGRPFSGPSGRRLCALAGLSSYEELTEAFDLRNLIDEKMAKKARGKGDEFPRALAAEAAEKLKYRLPMDFWVICMGNQVANLMEVGRAKTPLMTWKVKLYSTIGNSMRFPHPSGVSHFWNEPENVRKASEVLRSAMTLGRPADAS